MGKSTCSLFSLGTLHLITVSSNSKMGYSTLFSLDWREWALSTSPPCPPVQQKQHSVCAPGEKAAALSLPELLMLHSRQHVL